MGKIAIPHMLISFYPWCVPTYHLYLLSASVEDPARPPVVGRLRSSPVLS